MMVFEGVGVRLGGPTARICDWTRLPRLQNTCRVGAARARYSSRAAAQFCGKGIAAATPEVWAWQRTRADGQIAPRYTATGIWVKPSPS